MEEYSKPQLQDILKDRASLAFRYGAFSETVLELIADLAASEGGDARYAIDLLWRAGKYADASESREILPEYIREAIVNVYPTVEKELILSLGIHQRMFLLGIARVFKQTQTAYVSMGEAEEAYTIICEEYGKKRRGHTQLWKYVQELAALDIIGTKLSGIGQRGKTTLISLLKIPAVALEKELSKNFEKGADNLHAD
jgi:cell division control protein 6